MIVHLLREGQQGLGLPRRFSRLTGRDEAGHHPGAQHHLMLPDAQRLHHRQVLQRQ